MQSLYIAGIALSRVYRCRSMHPPHTLGCAYEVNTLISRFCLHDWQVFICIPLRYCICPMRILYNIVFSIVNRINVCLRKRYFPTSIGDAQAPHPCGRGACGGRGRLKYVSLYNPFSCFLSFSQCAESFCPNPVGYRAVQCA